MLDDFAIGAARIHYGVDRIFYSSTKCHDHNCTLPGHESPDYVEVNGKATDAEQWMVEYHPFGMPSTDSPLFSRKRFFGSLVTSYGEDAPNKKLIDGLGTGASLAAFDIAGERHPLLIGLGAVWLSEVQVLRNGAVEGEPIRAGLFSPTRTTSIWSGMLTVSLGL